MTTSLKEKVRCGKDMHDGSICGVILDCHLHDWRAKKEEWIDELLASLPGESTRGHWTAFENAGFNKARQEIKTLIEGMRG